MTKTRARACATKKSHPSKADAEAHRQRLIDRGAFHGSIHAYRCRHCKKWHVGHPPGSASANHTNPNRGGNVSRLRK